MDKARLGRTGLDVSAACLGTGGHSRLGLRRGASFDESLAIVAAAIDNGITIVDTAGTYGTEEIVGAAVAGRRDSIVISSKNHMVRDQETFYENEYVSGPEFEARVEASLRRLGTDYVDVMYVHGVTADQYGYCVDEIAPVLMRLRDQGKVRYTGISERFSTEPRHDMLNLALRDGYFDVIMVGLNLVNHTAVRNLLPLAKKNDIGVQCMYAVRGKLATPEGVRDLVVEAVAAGEVDPSTVDLDDPLGFLVRTGAARSVVDACYRFARHTPGVDTVLTGTGSIDHLLDNIRSINSAPLNAETIARLNHAFSRVESVTGE
jgi:aryl-alcohol dehydrogenase-like predicted oxidoreductase